VLTSHEPHPSRTFARHAFCQEQPSTGGTSEVATLSSLLDAFEQAANGSRDLKDKLLQSQKLAALGQMIASVAHDLNNPLTTVLGFAEMMLREETLPESAKGDLQTIHEAAQRASQIVRNILTYARKHRGPKPLVDINDLIERTLALRVHELNVSNVEVVKDLDPGIPLTAADPYQLQQVFLNLIINAEQAMLEHHGHGRLVIQTRACFVTGCRWGGNGDEHSAEPIEGIEIVVSDDGPGIPAAFEDRIFEPFFTTKPAGQGTGLGLPISRNIVEEHSGQMYARSQPSGGATFIIALPVVQETSHEIHGLIDQPVSPITSLKRVLIIDDEPTVVKLLEKLVQAEGHQADTAANGAEAFTKLERQSYDLIFCDTRMPRLNGRNLYQEVKRLSESLAEKMVFVTGDVTSEEARAFLEQTGCRFIEKPFTSEEVLGLMRAALTAEERPS
jgi:two-component system NtrC family sensor kinase